jgi:MFS family permease
VARNAFRFVILIGIVSCFADMIYEGARGLSGPFLASLGASGAAVGVAAGAGELVGFALRPLFGVLADRRRNYWTFTIIGYVMTAVAVPLLALAHDWRVAVALLIAERASKAVRSPSKDTILAHATASIGHGKGFGIHEAIDQIGAISSPLILSAVLAWKHDYALAFGLLIVPGVLTIATLFFARSRYPNPTDTEVAKRFTPQTLPKRFWLYVIGVGLVGAGFADFPLIAYHAREANILAADRIALVYAGAMAVDALAAYLFGILFDRYGVRVLTLSALIASGFAPLAFGDSTLNVCFGVALWGIGLGAQESVLRAAVASMAPADKRGAAYGFFNMAYGFAWFAGSALLGFMYDRSIHMVMICSVALQLLGAALLSGAPIRRTLE